MIRTFIENTLCGRTESTDPLRTWKKQRALTDGKSGAHVYLVKPIREEAYATLQ